jgi:DNA-binding NarL/FixJ family response regulator
MSSESQAPAQVRVVIIDDDLVLRAHLARAVDAAADISIVGQAGTIADALPFVDVAPDIALLDLGLPDGSGIKVIEALRARAPACKVLVVTVFEDRSSVLATLKAGADGYILKDTPSNEIVAAIRSTLAGETPISARAAGHLLSFVRGDAPKRADGAATPALSPRELELLELLARGLSRKEAARQMTLSPFTVAEYVQNIYRKLSVRSRSEAVYEAVQARLISLDRE